MAAENLQNLQEDTRIHQCKHIRVRTYMYSHVGEGTYIRTSRVSTYMYSHVGKGTYIRFKLIRVHV